MFEKVQLILDHVGVHQPAAAADEGEPLEGRAEQEVDAFDPGGEIGIGEEGGLVFVTASPTKTILSVGRMTHIAPEAGPG